MQMNPVKAIRDYCLECCGGSRNEVKFFQIGRCPLYAFRFGKNPHRKCRVISEQEKAMLCDRLANSRKHHSNTVEKTEDSPC